MHVRSAISSISVTMQGELKVEFINQKAALDSLVKMMGYLENKLNIESKQPIIMNFDSQDSEA